MGSLARGVRLVASVLYWTATFQLVRRVRALKYARLIRRSGLFQPEFYLAQCPGDRAARRDPIGHYLAVGAAAGLDPNPFFHTRFYLQENPELAGKNPLLHYVRHGAHEGRAPSERFDGAYYEERYPEVRRGGWPSPLAHYLEVGRREGRDAVRPPGAWLVPDLLEWAARHPSAEARRALVVDRSPGAPGQEPRLARTLAIVRALRQRGLDVTFAVDAPAQEDDGAAAELEALGVERVRGREAITAHLVAGGHLYASAMLAGPLIARRWLPLVRSHALWASIVYDAVMPAEGAAAGAQGAGDALDPGDRLAAGAAELVLATEGQAQALALAVPGVRIAVLPAVRPEALPAWPEGPPSPPAERADPLRGAGAR